ncbi:hypothetical protein D3C80_1213940 [compost metagenome]
MIPWRSCAIFAPVLASVGWWMPLAWRIRAKASSPGMPRAACRSITPLFGKTSVPNPLSANCAMKVLKRPSGRRPACHWIRIFPEASWDGSCAMCPVPVSFHAAAICDSVRWTVFSCSTCAGHTSPITTRLPEPRYSIFIPCNGTKNCVGYLAFQSKHCQTFATIPAILAT